MCIFFKQFETFFGKPPGFAPFFLIIRYCFATFFLKNTYCFATFFQNVFFQLQIWLAKRFSSIHLLNNSKRTKIQNLKEDRIFLLIVHKYSKSYRLLYWWHFFLLCFSFLNFLFAKISSIGRIPFFVYILVFPWSKKLERWIYQ